MQIYITTFLWSTDMSFLMADADVDLHREGQRVF